MKVWYGNPGDAQWVNDVNLRAARLPSLALGAIGCVAIFAIGTMLAGFSAAAFGYGLAFVVNALSFLVSAWAIWNIAMPGGFRAERKSDEAAVRPWHE